MLYCSFDKSYLYYNLNSTISFVFMTNERKPMNFCFLFYYWHHFLHLVCSLYLYLSVISYLYAVVSEARQFIQDNCRQTRAAHGDELETFLCDLPKKKKRIVIKYKEQMWQNCLKGLCHGLLSLNSQNMYLCHKKPTNNGLFLLTIAKLVCWNC